MRLPSCFSRIFTLTFLVYALLAASYVLPSLLLQMHFSVWDMGVLMSSFFIGATLARPAGSWLVERIGVRKSMAGAALAGAGAGLC